MKTRSLTEGAVLGAITVLITIVGQYFGIPPVIVAVPLVILVYRHDFKLGTLASLVAALISTLIIGDILVGLSIVISGFAGIAIGLALKEGFSFTKTLVVGTLSNIVVFALDVLFASLIMGKNILGEIPELFISSIEQTVSATESLGMVVQNPELVEAFMASIVVFLKWGLPALVFISAISVTFLNLALTRLILRRMNDSIPWTVHFSEWKLPSFYGLLFLAGLLLNAWAQNTTLPPALQFLGINLFIIFSTTYLILGVSVVWYYFRKHKVTGFLKGIFIVMLFIFPVLSYAMILLALIDGIFDFRKLRSSETAAVLDDNLEE